VLPRPWKHRGTVTWHHAERCNQRKHAHTHHHGSRGRAPGDSRHTQGNDLQLSAAYMIKYAKWYEGAPLGCATRSSRPSLLPYDPQRDSFASCLIQGPATPFPYTPSLWSSRTDTPQERQGHCATLWESENTNILPRAAFLPREMERRTHDGRHGDGGIFVTSTFRESPCWRHSKTQRCSRRDFMFSVPGG